MKLSILILTHNRPELFKRCLTSVLEIIPDDVEILVNNDAEPFKELSNNIVKYYYKKSDNISDLYRFLLEKAQGEFIFYLEDDDFLLPNFFKRIDYNYDINYMNFMTYDIKKTLQLKKENFKVEKENVHFQLSQILFKKSLVKSFPNDNNLHNDWNLFQSLDSNDINIIHSYQWVQTTDGKDNISFPEFNKDSRWNSLNKKV